MVGATWYLGRLATGPSGKSAFHISSSDCF